MSRPGSMIVTFLDGHMPASPESDVPGHWSVSWLELPEGETDVYPSFADLVAALDWAAQWTDRIVVQYEDKRFDAR